MTLNRTEALAKLAQTSKGDARAELLKNEGLRKSVLSSGANVTIFSGEITSGKNFKEIFSDIYIGLIQRKNKKGNYDGLGALGGLAERTDKQQFSTMSETEKASLLGQKDDVVVENGTVVLTDNIDIIRRNNVIREMNEELSDLSIQGISINPEKLQLVPMPCVKDDNYMINIWNGNGVCFAITPYCHLYKDNENLLDKLSTSAKEKKEGEASSYKKVKLFDALSAYGNPGSKEVSLEDGRSAINDYRYPHEHIAAWFLASQLLEHNPEKFIALTQEVQKSTNHPISFEKLAKATGQNISDLAQILKVPTETLQKSDKKCANILCLLKMKVADKNK